LGFEAPSESVRGARTLYPENLGSAFGKYVLSFNPANIADVDITSGMSQNGIVLPVGDYTVTATGHTGSAGSWVVAAEGSATVSILKSPPATANIILGPKTGGADGTFSYSINLSGVTGLDDAKGTLRITQLDGTLVGSAIDLTENTTSSGTVALAPGYYLAGASLSKGSEKAGFGMEALHIYTGLTSAVSKTYTAADFAELVVVDDLDLTSLVPKPVEGAAPVLTVNESQYTGSVAWDPSVSGSFAATTAYTATVTLTAKAGYTFEGVGEDAFSHSNATTVTNDEDSGTVTLVFEATAAATGSMNATLSLINYGEIPVSGAASAVAITQGGASKTLSVAADYENVVWRIDGDEATEVTGNSITLNPDDYTVKGHTLTVTGTKGGIPYGRNIAFTVAEAGGGGGGGSYTATYETLGTVLDGLAANDADTPYTVQLESFVVQNGDNWKTCVDAISDSGKYVILDLSLCTAPDDELRGDSSPETSDFNYIKNAPTVVGLILPNSITTLGKWFLHGVSSLKSIVIPPSVTVETFVFVTVNKSIASWTVGADCDFSAMDAPWFDPFETLYASASGGAGTYLYNGDTGWTKQ
jgi:hypothetical protein